jgi:hypothetical protein
MKVDDEIENLENAKKSTRFDYLARVCQVYFGNPRIKGSHHIYKTPWPGDPRINLQRDDKDKAMAKPYQVKQVVAALRKLQEMEENKKKGESLHVEG